MSNKSFCSWSGGKDSTLSLYKALKDGLEVKYLLNMMNEDGKNSRSHNLSLEIIKAQADSLGIPLITKNTTWDTYEEIFVDTLKQFEKEGIKNGIFGDIDIEDHRKWEEMVCKKAKLNAVLPLWQQKRKVLLKEFLDLNFKTMIIVVNENYLDKKYLGKILDKELVNEFEEIGIDPNGENGEYHTVVLDGPIFNYPLEIEKQDKLYNEGYWFQKIKLINT
ncbi:MAG: diphthine--ammonia ligase [Halanaerobiales bacterium]|nr:diphthine--ammonia ligase [Halanaerobiales bacterium]